MRKDMNTRDIKRIGVAVLVAICIASWWYAISIYQTNKQDITVTVSNITREIALPYRIAQLSNQPPTQQLPVPVYDIQQENIADTWSATRAEGRSHEGVDIFADRGTPVFSATEGYVVETNIGSLGGINVMTVGPGGVYYYYAHLKRMARGIKRGTPVTTDTVLGFVGNSGNATGTPPHLHFGVYPNPGKWQAVNPYPLLVDRWSE